MSGAGWSAVWPPLIVLIPAIAIVCMQNRNLSLISLGDDVCRGLGVRADPVSALILIVAVIVAAVCVSSAGPIAFVALLAPQIAHAADPRRGTRPDHLRTDRCLPGARQLTCSAAR